MPYDQHGNLMFWVDERHAYSYLSEDYVPYTMRPNIAFAATLTIDSMRSGRSAKYLVWRDPDDHHYPVMPAPQEAPLVAMLPLAPTAGR